MYLSPTTGDRVFTLVCLVLAGCVLSSMGAFATTTLQMDVLGSPLGVDVNGRWVLSALLVGLTAFGTDLVIRGEAGARRIDRRYSLTFWILPSLTTLAAATAIPRIYGSPIGWMSGLVLLGLLLALVIGAELHTVDLEGVHYRRARLGLNVATYGAAFALYATIYGFQVRGLLSMPAILAVTFPLALELLRGTEEQLETTWLYAGVVGLTVSQVTWAISMWGISALAGGSLLLLVFYTFSGIAQQHLAGRLSNRVVAEFVSIAVFGLIVIWASSPWLAGAG